MSLGLGVGADAPLTVLCAVRGPIEAEVVSLLARDQSLTVTRRCADLAELLAGAAAGLGRVAVLSADLAGLDRAAVSALHADGVRVVVVGSPGSHSRLAALGIDRVVDAVALAADLVDAVRDVSTAVPLAAHAGTVPRAGAAPPPPDVRASDPAVLVAVWGPTGAPGRSTVAANLAAELVSTVSVTRGRPGSRGIRAGSGPESADTALLVDADTYSGSLAQITGMLDDSSGIAAACRAAGQGVLTTLALAKVTPLIGPRLRILTGISRARRWPELSAPTLDVVWERCRDLARWTVVDCGFGLETDELLSYDTHAPQRNAATLSALAAADVVVVVGGADPVSMHRLVRGLDDLRECGVAERARRVVVVNRVRESAVGPRPVTVLREALQRYAGVTEAVFVPDDRALDGARLAGRLLAEFAPTSPARRALHELAQVVREWAPGSSPEPTRVAHRPTSASVPWPATVAH